MNLRGWDKHKVQWPHKNPEHLRETVQNGSAPKCQVILPLHGESGESSPAAIASGFLARRAATLRKSVGFNEMPESGA
jgi:hypothetical protein